MQTKSSVLDYIQNGQLPELPISVDKESIVYIFVALLILGIILILFSKFINRF